MSKLRRRSELRRTSESLYSDRNMGSENRSGLPKLLVEPEADL